MRRIAMFAFVTWVAGCGTDLPGPVFRADYATTFTEVRNCRPSLEHGPDNIRVLASPEAVTVYTTRTGTFSPGALLLKEQYYSSDPGCTGKIKQWTVMQKLADGSSTGTLDWHWQRVAAGRSTTTDNDATCIACHRDCGGAGGGFLDTCTDP
jgi:hypothetical protein